MAILDTFEQKGGPDGSSTGFGVNVRKVFFKDDNLVGTKDYSAIVLPKGFIPRHVVVNVISKNSTAATVTIGTAKTGETAVTKLGTTTVSLQSLGLHYVGSFELGASGANAAFVAGENDRIVVTPTADTDCKFEIGVSGDMPCVPEVYADDEE